MSTDTRIERIEDKIDALGQKLGSIDSTLAAQHESLKQHMRRTELLEQALVPVQKHVNHIEGVVKFAGLIALLVGIIGGLIPLLGYMSKK